MFDMSADEAAPWSSILNIAHLRYAVAIAEAHSITRAAQRLLQSQPNLSRAIRELERSIGVTIFRRSPKGIATTPDGDEFLDYARKVLAEFDGLESMFKGKERERPRTFSISTPRASYISQAFSNFVRKIGDGAPMEFFYNETSPRHVITNITEADYRLGILRFPSAYRDNFEALLKEKGLHWELVFEFHYVLLMSRRHPLAKQKEIFLADTAPYVEIAHADPFVPSMSFSTIRRNEHYPDIDKHIYVFERGSQLELLADSTEAFMWVSPMPKSELDRYGLVERVCADNSRMYRDLFIHRKGYALSDLDKEFIRELQKSRKNVVEELEGQA